MKSVHKLLNQYVRIRAKTYTSIVTLLVNGKEVGKVTVEKTVPTLFTASESFDVGMDKGSGVAMDYHDKIPFKFNGKIHNINIKYIE